MRETMNLTRWEPFEELVSLRDAMNRLFEESFVTPSLFRSGTGPRRLVMDVYETPEAYVVEAPMPGIKPEEIQITLTGNTLMIHAEQKREEEHKERKYAYQERYFGALHREITLPHTVQLEGIEATLKEGLLHLTVPKAEEAKPKQIPIQVAVKEPVPA
jgi:HSP20 family protein